MKLDGAAGIVVVNVVPADINMVGIGAEIYGVVVLGRRRTHARVVDLIAIEFDLAGLAHLKAADVAVRARALNVIADDSPAGAAYVHRLLPADNVQLRDHPIVFPRAYVRSPDA